MISAFAIALSIALVLGFWLGWFCRKPETVFVHEPVSAAFVRHIQLAAAHSEKLKKAVNLGDPIGVRFHQGRLEYFIAQAQIELIYAEKRGQTLAPQQRGTGKQEVAHV